MRAISSSCEARVRHNAFRFLKLKEGLLMQQPLLLPFLFLEAAWSLEFFSSLQLYVSSHLLQKPNTGSRILDTSHWVGKEPRRGREGSHHHFPGRVRCFQMCITLEMASYGSKQGGINISTVFHKIRYHLLSFYYQPGTVLSTLFIYF